MWGAGGAFPQTFPLPFRLATPELCPFLVNSSSGGGVRGGGAVGVSVGSDALWPAVWGGRGLVGPGWCGKP